MVKNFAFRSGATKLSLIQGRGSFLDHRFSLLLFALRPNYEIKGRQFAAGNTDVGFGPTTRYCRFSQTWGCYPLKPSPISDVPELTARVARGWAGLGSAVQLLETAAVPVVITLRPLLSVTWTLKVYVPAARYVCVPRTSKAPGPAAVTVVLGVAIPSPQSIAAVKSLGLAPGSESVK